MDCESAKALLKPDQCVFPSRVHASEHISTRQYERMLKGWVASIGLDPAAYGTHTTRRTMATLIYRLTKNLRAVQLLLGHTKLESTVRYLGIVVDDALEISEQTEISLAKIGGSHRELVAAFSRRFGFSVMGVAPSEEVTRTKCGLHCCTLCSAVI